MDTAESFPDDQPTLSSPPRVFTGLTSASSITQLGDSDHIAKDDHGTPGHTARVSTAGSRPSIDAEVESFGHDCDEAFSRVSNASQLTLPSYESAPIEEPALVEAQADVEDVVSVAPEKKNWNFRQLLHRGEPTTHLDVPLSPWRRTLVTFALVMAGFMVSCKTLRIGSG
jgi:hypothetical protein